MTTTNETNDYLFQTISMAGNLNLKNRIVMAPLTRCMADDNLVPTQLSADYYRRRANAGLIITEATLVSQDGQGYPNTPGLYTDEQVAAWSKITDAVHSEGGKIFAQIWHTGRVSHSSYRSGDMPIAPSAVGLSGRVPQTEYEFETPRAMEQHDINRIIQCFKHTAKNAVKAGFDGVEVHGANGYLIDEFLHWDSNRRTDTYGGNPENMARFLFQILDAVKEEIPEQRIGLRLSPQAYVNMEHDERDKTVFEYILSQLNQRALTYVHTGIFNDAVYPHLEGTTTQFIRRHYQGTVIASGGYSAQSGNETIKQGDADLIAIGRSFIANPNYVELVKTNQTIKAYDEGMLATLY